MMSSPQLILGAFLVLAIAVSGAAKDFYIRAGLGSGGNNGSDWNNAWQDCSSIQWASITPGDTIWFAGGTYGSLQVQAGGDATGWLLLKRVRSTDSVPAHAAGWSGSFDSQVIINGGMLLNTEGINHVYVDGRVDMGIQLASPNCIGNDSSLAIKLGASYLTFTNVDFLGPQSNPNGSSIGNNPITMNSDLRAVDGTAWNGSVYENIDHLVISHCRLRGHVTEMWLYNVTDSTVEYCQIYDNGALNSAAEHGNVCATSQSSNITWRYNSIYNWQVEGIMFKWGAGVNWYIYGNVWHDGMGGKSGNTHRVLECEDGPQGPVYFYNNTVANCYEGVNTDTSSSGSWVTGSTGRNNIYWNTGTGTGPGLVSDDYDFASFPLTESHKITGTNSPFVSLGQRDYHLLSTVNSTMPRNKGLALSAQYKTDMDGTLRGWDGAWDIGAYEFPLGTNPVMAVSPSSLSFGLVSGGTTNYLTFKVQNLGGGTLAGTASVAPPFYVDGPAAYSLGSGQMQAVRVRYSPSGAPGDNQIVTFTGGGGGSATITGNLAPNSPGP